MQQEEPIISGIRGPLPDEVAHAAARRISARLAELDELDSPGELDELQRDALTQALIRIDAAAKDHEAATANVEWPYEADQAFIDRMYCLSDLYSISLKVNGPETADDLRGCIRCWTGSVATARSSVW